MTSNINSVEYLFDTYYRSLCSFAYRYIEDNEMAEDIVQETFIYIWQNKPKFTDDIATKVYLYRTVKNKCLNKLNHFKVKAKAHDNIQGEIEESNLFESHFLHEETIRLFYQAIETLPDQSRAVIKLALNGLSNPEIAEDLGISVNTVKTHKKSAYSTLRIKLKDVFPLFLLYSDIF
jgi:RNA polymerase sigma-70 factor (family 1)